MIDSFGRKINYLRVSITDLCNLRCTYCMPECGVQKIEREDILKLEEIFELVKIFTKLGIDKVRLTGGEPLIRKGLPELVKNIGSLQAIKDFSMTTNGILLKDYASVLKKSGLSRVNVSLDTMDEEKYRQITRGGSLKKVLEGIEEAKRVGLSPIKINTVLIGGFNEDEIENFVNLTVHNEIDIRFIELMPMGQVGKWSREKFIPGETVLNKVKDLIPVDREDISSPASYYKLKGAKGKIGIISPMTCKFCEDCNRLRLTSDGKLKLCLHSKEMLDLKYLLRSGKNIEEAIINFINKKPQSHHLEDGNCVLKNMAAIGG